MDPFQGADVWTIDPVLQRIEDALKKLGGTSKGVAARLAMLKCRGERGHPGRCPVAVYLKKQRVGKFDVKLIGTRVEVSGRDGWTDLIDLPPAVEWFAMRFDRGEFPECASPDSGPGTGYVKTDWNAIHAAEGAAAATPQAA